MNITQELNNYKTMEQTGRPLSYGEKAVGITFNPSNDDAVYKAKELMAKAIDQMYTLRENSQSAEQKRLASIAITELQGTQMWMVKALTWKDL